jgi:hypothetical protein
VYEVQQLQLAVEEEEEEELELLSSRGVRGGAGAPGKQHRSR